MRIVCPSCTAAYDVPDERLAPGRTVKCARCGTGWAPLAALAEPPPPEPEPEPEPEPAPVIEPPAEPPAPVERPPVERPVVSAQPAPRTAVLGWALSVAVLLGLGWSAYHWRADIMRAWPPSERAFAALGLAG